MLKESHNGEFAGHFTKHKIYATLREHYWWRSMRNGGLVLLQKLPGLYRKERAQMARMSEVAAKPCTLSYCWHGCA